MILIVFRCGGSFNSGWTRTAWWPRCIAPKAKFLKALCILLQQWPLHPKPARRWIPVYARLWPGLWAEVIGPGALLVRVSSCSLSLWTIRSSSLKESGDGSRVSIFEDQAALEYYSATEHHPLHRVMGRGTHFYLVGRVPEKVRSTPWQRSATQSTSNRVTCPLHRYRCSRAKELWRLLTPSPTYPLVPP